MTPWTPKVCVKSLPFRRFLGLRAIILHTFRGPGRHTLLQSVYERPSRSLFATATWERKGAIHERKQINLGSGHRVLGAPVLAMHSTCMGISEPKVVYSFWDVPPLKIELLECWVRTIAVCSCCVQAYVSLLDTPWQLPGS